MRLLLKLRRIGSQTYRTYIVDHEALLPPIPLPRPHEWLLAELSEAMNTAQRNRTSIKIPVVSASGKEKKLCMLHPTHYRVCTLEWEP